ncbi:hypothetical protein QBC42DRAFT_317381 [Cladorrhinum samala]|uniref:Uncharacterized protein n=1 Tax=Cladorrhinum samala TaxID=585594 RepID=A0AAV9HA06_9PEZI|nr:hypothetical protein QBC42DRAFT_317381 [Cladorrhinum samala]
MASLDSFPSVDALVGGSKSDVGITAGWDMVVSYSLSSLNTVLQRLWTNSITSTTTVLQTVSTNEDDEEYHTNWWLHLGAPTLQFTSDGRASLCMPLDGKRQVVEKTASGKDRPVREIPANTYALYAVVPLEFVSARSGSGDKAYKFEGGSGKVIRFDEHPDAELHVVLNFQTTMAQGAVYTVGLLPGYQPPEGTPKPSPTDDFTVGLRDKLAAWIANPEHISCIQYALAVVNKKPVKDAAFLTPERLSFSVYSSSKDKSVGCLSIYMKTQGSGFCPGNVIRSFTLPASANVNTFPIPSGHTASIIIRHDLFAQKFLRDSMLALQKDNHKVFNSVTVNPSKEGFDLTASINGRAAANFGNATWFGGGFKVTDVDWDWGANGLGLKIRDSKCSWSYEFTPELSWSEINSAGDGHHTFVAYGKTTYNMKLDKTNLALFEDASDVGLVARVKVQADDWSRKAEAHEYGLLERLNGAKNYIPSSIDGGLEKIELPTFSDKLALEYFTTTNIFAPGKHLLSISGASSVYTPYDVIIFGDVLDTPAMTVSAPTWADADGQEKLAVATGEASNDKKKNMSDLINDLSLGRPILRQLTAAGLSDGDDDGQVVAQVLEKAGYQITKDDATKALEAEKAGPNFDVRFVAGLYSFDQPADLKDDKNRMMMVDGGSGRIFIGQTRVNSTTDSQGNVTWTQGDHTYSITFTAPYNSKGTPDPKTFLGTRKHRTTGNEDVVSGTQVVPTPDSDFWTNLPGPLTLGWIATILGTALGIYCYVIAARAERRKALKEDLVSAAEHARHLAEIDASRQPIPNEVVDKILSDFKTDIEARMREVAVDKNAIHDDDPVEGDPKAAAEAAQKTLRERVLEATRTQFMTKIQSGIMHYIGPEAVAAAMQHQVQKLLSETDVLDRFGEHSPFVGDIVESEKAHFEANQARTLESSRIAAEHDAVAAVDAIKQAIVDEKTNLQKRASELIEENQNITLEDMKKDANYSELEKKIADLEKNEHKALNDFLEASKKRKDAEDERKNKEKDADDKEKKAKDSAKEAFDKVKHV